MSTDSPFRLSLASRPITQELTHGWLDGLAVSRIAGKSSTYEMDLVLDVSDISEPRLSPSPILSYLADLPSSLQCTDQYRLARDLTGRDVLVRARVVAPPGRSQGGAQLAAGAGPGAGGRLGLCHVWKGEQTMAGLELPRGVPSLDTRRACC